MANDLTEWKDFTRRIYVSAPIKTLFGAWATSAGLENWFLESAVFFSPDGTKKDSSELIREGDTYKWKWFGYDLISKGKVIEINDKDHMKFTFGENEEIIHLDFIEKGDRVLIELRQYQKHPELEDRKRVYVGCYGGWTYHLANLKSVYEGGLDLREKNPDIDNLINS